MVRELECVHGNARRLLRVLMGDTRSSVERLVLRDETEAKSGSVVRMCPDEGRDSEMGMEPRVPAMASTSCRAALIWIALPYGSAMHAHCSTSVRRWFNLF